MPITESKSSSKVSKWLKWKAATKTLRRNHHMKVVQAATLVSTSAQTRKATNIHTNKTISMEISDNSLSLVIHTITTTIEEATSRPPTRIRIRIRRRTRRTIDLLLTRTTSNLLLLIWISEQPKSIEWYPFSIILGVYRILWTLRLANLHFQLYPSL